MNINPVSFGKSYISNAPAYNINRGREENLDFVEYEDTFEDKEKVSQTLEDWVNYGVRNSYLYEDMKDELETSPSSRFFGIEDENEEIQSLAQVTITGDGDNKNLEIDYALTNPENAHGSYSREYAGLGKTMFKKIIETAIDEGCRQITLADESEGFWDSLPCFKNQQGSEEKFLPKNKFEQTIDLLG